MPGPPDPTNPMAMPPGLLSSISDYVYFQSMQQVKPIANFAAIALLSGITGRAFNTYTGAGLNQYMLMLAGTGSGKENIASGISKLFSAVECTVPSAADFKGPGELVSSAGTIKWMERKPCTLSILGEFSHRFHAMADSRAAPNEKSLQRTLLQLYSKSGTGNVFDPIAYSDKEKNTAPIISPSLTLVGEGAPEAFYQSLDAGMIASGLLPRFMVFEYLGERPHSNADRQIEPCPQLVSRLADLCALCLGIMQTGKAVVIPANSNAMSVLLSFDDECTDLINLPGEVSKHLWNRAHLKALKLATLSAISVASQWQFVKDNPASIQPSICLDDALWAIATVRAQTELLIGKFERNEVGAVEGNESKQTAEVMRIIRHYLTSRWEQVAVYHGTADMHRDGVFTKAHITQRLGNTAAFKSEREKPTVAIKRVLDQLLSSDEIRQMPKTQMLAKYGKHPEAYLVSDFARFSAL